MVFSRNISLYNCSVQNSQNLCPKCPLCTQTQALMMTAPLADSGVDD